MQLVHNPPYDFACFNTGYPHNAGADCRHRADGFLNFFRQRALQMAGNKDARNHLRAERIRRNVPVAKPCNKHAVALLQFCQSAYIFRQNAYHFFMAFYIVFLQLFGFDSNVVANRLSHQLAARLGKDTHMGQAVILFLPRFHLNAVQLVSLFGLAFRRHFACLYGKVRPHRKCGLLLCFSLLFHILNALLLFPLFFPQVLKYIH